MKAVAQIDLDGLYVEDVLVEDSFVGVQSVYALPELPKWGEEPETLEDGARQKEESKPDPIGYLVGIPVPPGLYRARFDLNAWEDREEETAKLPADYWLEGLTPEEIKELMRPPVEEASELEKLQKENLILRAKAEALERRTDMQEEILTEIIMKVYE